jgi:tRNA G18 (ribose-2'-O)-methylase SpoU
MPLFPIATLDDPRLAPYRTLKDHYIAARHGLFIAEGEQLVKRLLASKFRTQSVLIADRRLEELGPLFAEDIDVYVVTQSLMNELAGIKFHSGVLAAGIRQPPPTLEQLLSPNAATIKLVVCPEIAIAENLGSMIRLAAGFGADALIVGPRSSDPFLRRTIRVSMGTTFYLPIVESTDLAVDFTLLKQRWGVHCVAGVLDGTATPINSAARHDRLALVFGNEAQGLDPRDIALCDERVTIPMKLGTDSLNVAIAAGIFLYHYWS